jgi:hypothetical protein
MLLVLIAIVWVALLTLLAAVCRVAAEGDRMQAPAQSRGAIGERLILFGGAQPRRVQARRRARREPAIRMRRSAHRAR